jgi:hypothetical protein
VPPAGLFTVLGDHDPVIRLEDFVEQADVGRFIIDYKYCPGFYFAIQHISPSL